MTTEDNKNIEDSCREYYDIHTWHEILGHCNSDNIDYSYKATCNVARTNREATKSPRDTTGNQRRDPWLYYPHAKLSTWLRQRPHGKVYTSFNY